MFLVILTTWGTSLPPFLHVNILMRTLIELPAEQTKDEVRCAWNLLTVGLKTFYELSENFAEIITQKMKKKKRIISF